jgi:hypothetical protein
LVQETVDRLEKKRFRHLLLLGVERGLPATEEGASSPLPEDGEEGITLFGSEEVGSCLVGITRGGEDKFFAGSTAGA